MDEVENEFDRFRRQCCDLTSCYSNSYSEDFCCYIKTSLSEDGKLMNTKPFPALTLSHSAFPLQL